MERDETLTAEVESLFVRLEEWPLAKANYMALASVQTRELSPWVSAMHNPGRVRSTGADLSKPRPQSGCFLCRANRPAEQTAVSWDEGRYEILVNPFPIFRRHLTIVSTAHVRQSFDGAPAEMFRLGRALQGFTIFFNGAQCGASAPEHRHYQAYGRSEGLMSSLEGCRHGVKKEIEEAKRFRVSAYEDGCKLVYAVECQGADGAESAFSWLFAHRRIDEELINVVLSGETFYVIPRRQGRPRQFYEQDESKRLMVSPATVEMCGLIVLPRKEDYENITLADVEDVMRQVAYQSDKELMR